MTTRPDAPAPHARRDDRRTTATYAAVLVVEVVVLLALWAFGRYFGRALTAAMHLARLARRRRLPRRGSSGTACGAPRPADEVEGYFLANRSLPWWAVGLSVMATQLSAITLVGTTGQGYADGMRFVQFYFGLPIAMIILSRDGRAVLLPRRRLHRLRVPRAALRREDAHAHEPAVPALARPVVRRRSSPRRPSILSIVLGWNLTLTVLAIGAADGALHDGRRRAGRDLDRRQADGRRSSSACSPRWSLLVLALPDGRQRRRRRCTWPAPTGRLQALDFRFDLTQDLHVLVGHASAACS